MTYALILNLFALLMISCRVGVIEGQTITPVYIQSNASVTFTCPAYDQATTLTWTGPGDTLYVTGTTVEAGLDGSVKPRISARHTGGSYTLKFTKFRSSDTGIYTCTVDGTVDIQMVVVQGMTSASPVYTRQGGTVTLQCPDTGGSASWVATSTLFIYYDGTDFNPAIPEDTRTRLSVTIQDGTNNLQTSDVQLSDVREYRCNSGSTNTFYHLLLYIPPAFPEIANTVSVDGQNRTTGTEDGSMTLTCNSRGGTPAASVSWSKDGTTLVTSDNSVQYTKAFTRADDRTVYTCQSSSPALTSPQTTSVLVYLDLKPAQPAISDQLSQTVNTNLQVVCVSTGSRPEASIQWNVGGAWQSNNPTEVKAKDSATDSYTATSTLSLPVTRQDNGKSVYCRASNQALSGGIESVRRSITVLFGPDSASITGNRVIVADGTNTLTLTCTTQEYNKHIHITWYNGTTRIPNTAGVTNTSGTNRGSVSTQVLQLTPNRYQDGDGIMCVVQNDDVTLGEKTASVILNINYRPYLTLTPTPGTKVIEGGELEIGCDVHSNPAPSSITWLRIGGQLPSNSDVTSGVLRIPSTHRSDRGTYQCTALNSAGTGQSSLTIDIYYPPDIFVSYTNSTYMSPSRVLTCDPDGNPDTYQFGQWRHTAEDGTEIRQLTGGSSPLQSVLTLPDPGVTRRYEDTGYYVCEASNNIPDSSFYSSGSVFFVVEAPPLVVTNTTVVKGLIGDNMTIEVEFYSRPSVSPNDVTWTRGFKRSPLPDRSVSSVDTRSILMPFHGVDVKVKCYVAILEMNTMTEGDFGEYTVTMENSQGKENYTVHLISTGPPSPPLYLLQKEITSTSITVQWIPGSDRGLKQTFVMGYRSEVTADYTYSDDIPDDMEPIITYTLDGLTINTLYSIRVHAQNGLGMSKPLILNISTTQILCRCQEVNGEAKEAKNGALYSAGVVLISVSSVLFVLAVAVTVFITINKRTSLSRSDTNKAVYKRDSSSCNIRRDDSSKDDDHHHVDATPSSLSLYEDIHDHEQRPSDPESNYEVLGGQSLPNVYEDLKRVKDGPDSNYENTAV